MEPRTRNPVVRGALSLALLATFNLQPATFAQGTAFTYQGQLQNNGALANGTYNLTFSLFTTSSGGTSVAGPVATNGVVITNGLFTVTIDFGSGVWNGATNWLQIGVETNGGSGFTALNPRQRVAPTPYAITAENLDGNLSAGGLVGTYTNAVNFSSSANSFAGNGSGLTGVNAASLNGLSAANFWQTSGNAGTTPGANFVGTTDNQPLELHANGLRSLRLEPALAGHGAPNVIGGSPVNWVSNTIYGATIAGGGATNYSGAAYSNSVTTIFGTIGGGFGNAVGGPYAATIGGGFFNIANGAGAFIGGGALNLATGGGSTIGGGQNNTNSAAGATIAGGEYNTVFGPGAFVGGGGFDGSRWIGNGAWGSVSVVGGGLGNYAYSNYTTIGGGSGNEAYYPGSTVAGGYGCWAIGSNATVAGGAYNLARGFSSFIGGGGDSNNAFTNNNASGDFSIIGGGFGNTASGKYAIVVGGDQNTGSGAGSSVGGGGYDGTGQAGNLASGNASVVGGGLGNSATNYYTVVCGGSYNSATGYGAFVGGGGNDGTGPDGNVASGPASVVCGGYGNQADNWETTVGGGIINTASGFDSTVAGGAINTASGTYAVVLGGYDNTASGYASIAAGAQANATLDNSFLFNGFPNPAYSFKPSRLQVFGTNGISIDYFTQRPDGGGTHWIVLGDGGSQFGGQTISTWTGAYLSDSGTWQNVSDRNRKTDLESIDPQAVLEKVTALPVQSWRYTNEAAGVKHIGPMAQDFKASLGLGTDDKTISTVDEGGVALAAIQGLNEKVETLKAELKRRETENTELKARLEWLEKVVLKQRTN